MLQREGAAGSQQRECCAASVYRQSRYAWTSAIVSGGVADELPRRVVIVPLAAQLSDRRGVHSGV
ncbi:hypothetical protein E2C01_045333 [Portunus trituberculatus]|uniref:Uncharacterized protein n=1 Tax=Portunus trituberculatus TaxID=210409 RepID=A0A5B7G1R6_PORTR|nr:hypothetical protein [Portunus trituberculatus]